MLALAAAAILVPVTIAALLAAGARVLLLLLAIAIHVAPTALLLGSIAWLAFVGHGRFLLSLTPDCGHGSNEAASTGVPHLIPQMARLAAGRSEQPTIGNEQNLPPAAPGGKRTLLSSEQLLICTPALDICR